MQAYKVEREKRLSALEQYRKTVLEIDQEKLIEPETARTYRSEPEEIPEEPEIQKEDSLETVSHDVAQEDAAGDWVDEDVSAADKEDLDQPLTLTHLDSKPLKKPAQSSLLDPLPPSLESIEDRKSLEAISRMGQFIAEGKDEYDDNQLLLLDDEKSMGDKSDALDASKYAFKHMTQSQRAEQVTSKLLELQQKHKEISEKVQSVLIDTVDFAFGSNQPTPADLKKAMANMKAASKRLNISTEKANRKKEEARLRQSKREKLREKRRMERQALKQKAYMDSMAYSQGVGSVPYGLPCVAVTRRNQVQQYQLYEQERVNLKLC